MLILTAIPDLLLLACHFFFSSDSFPVPKNPNTLSHCYTHTQIYTHTHIPRERDGSVTIGKQRLLVTENALRREPGPQSGGEEVVGLRRAWTGESTGPFPPPLCSKLSRFTRPPGVRGEPILVPSNLDSS